MFKKSNIMIYNEDKVLEFNNLRVIDIEKMDMSIFRTDYLKNRFSMIEYVDRLKEVYNSNESIESKIPKYLAIENSMKSDIDKVGERDKKFIYFSLGYFLSKTLQRLKVQDGYKIYNYGVYENNDLIVAYFDISTKRYDFDFTDFKDMLCKILKVDVSNVIFNKIGEVYELILYKKDFLSVDFSTLFNLTNFEDLENEGYMFPLIVGKDESCRNIYLDLERNNSILMLGSSGSGKSNMLNLLLMNMVCLYSEDELSLIMMSDDNEINKNFSYAPHFLGYHTDKDDYINVLREVKIEMETRREIIGSANVSVWQDLREYLTKEEEYDLLKAFPWIVVIMDDIDNLIRELKIENDGRLKEVEDLISYIIDNGRKYGVKIVMVGQDLRGFLSKSVMDKVAMKIIFKMTGNSLDGLINDRYVDPPVMVGEFVLDDKDIIYPISVKSAILGINDDKKLSHLVRTMVVDMLRNSDEGSIYRSPVFVKTLNRDLYVKEEFMTEDSLFEVKRSTRVFDIALDLLKGRFESSNYK